MYFENVNKTDISTIVKDIDNVFAHINEGQSETLFEHVELSISYFNKLVKDKNLDPIFKKIQNGIIKGFSKEGIKIYKEMILNTIYLHDIGKINCTFQSKKMENKRFANYKGNTFNYSNHSMLSSIIYIDQYFAKIKTHNIVSERNHLFTLVILNSYIISKHHGNLDSIDNYLNKLIESDGEGYKLLEERSSIYKDIYISDLTINLSIMQRLVKGTKHMLECIPEMIEYYIYIRFLSSLLLSSDYYATSQFMNNREMLSNGTINDINVFYDKFKSTDVYKWIRKYEMEEYGKTNDLSNIDNINILRNELFLDAERTLLNNKDKNIYYLEAPTGSGKSNVAFNLSFKLLEVDKDLNKIFYVYPFNTLVEQNIDTLKGIFIDKDIMNNVAVINSIVPIRHDKRSKVDESEMSDISDKSYEQSLLDRQFLQYPIILTTHVSLFNFLFGISKENLFPLAQLANSVVILDEIQSYKNKIWKEIIIFLNYYSEILNIKFIIMSATLPNLNELFQGKLNSSNLISNREKYFHNRIFRNRVISDFSLLDSDNMKEDIFSHVVTKAKENNKNILIEFIRKDSAVGFYKDLKECTELGNKKIELITGDDNRVERNRIIRMLKEEKEDGDIILVATQVIEAGVDIDMDIGYKDISMLDAEEQFLGRINRSSKNKDCGIVYFFDLDDAGKIYKGDVRKEKHININNEEFQEIFMNKDFEDFYRYVFDYLDKEASRLNEDSYDSFMKNNVNNLEFDTIQDRMSLIDNRFEYSVFLNRTIEIDECEILIGEEVWNKYIEILSNNEYGYAEKKIRLSEVTSQMAYFIYKLNHNNFIFNGQVGDLYYIDDGEKYFVDGKFDRGKFSSTEVDFI